MSVHNSAGAAAVLCLASETFERFHLWRRSTTLRYDDKWNSVLWHDLSQRECVCASVISAADKCAQCRSEVYTHFVREIKCKPEQRHPSWAAASQQLWLTPHTSACQRNFGTTRDLSVRASFASARKPMERTVSHCPAARPLDWICCKRDNILIDPRTKVLCAALLSMKYSQSWPRRSSGHVSTTSKSTSSSIWTISYVRLSKQLRAAQSLRTLRWSAVTAVLNMPTLAWPPSPSENVKTGLACTIPIGTWQCQPPTLRLSSNWPSHASVRCHLHLRSTTMFSSLVATA